jgi:hypothetical protein
MLTYILGPFLALFPKRWRKAFSLGVSVDWRRAAALSGFAESVIALIALMYWYSYSMTTWVDRALDAGLAGKLPTGVTDHDIGFTALVIWTTHPLTWLIAYTGLEGAVRFVGAAFSENNMGILPLFLLDKVFLKITGRGGPDSTKTAGYWQGHLSSYLGAIREKVRETRLVDVPDELSCARDASDEILEIRACRRKVDWTPPRTVRYQDTFYRLEGFSEGAEPRPFRYTLRRLAAGVMGRTVLVYSPKEEPVLTKR